MSSDYVIRNLYISHKEMYIKLSDNYFDVVPGEDYIVTLKDLTVSQVKEGLVFRSYVQTYTSGDLTVKFE